MLHSTNSQKDFKIEGIIDWTGSNEDGLIICEEFYAIADLEEDGFIHPDGSLRFEYSIKKRNLLKKLAEAEATINEL